MSGDGLKIPDGMVIVFPPEAPPPDQQPVAGAPAREPPVAGAYSFDFKEEDLKKYGVTLPNVEVRMMYGLKKPDSKAVLPVYPPIESKVVDPVKTSTEQETREGFTGGSFPWSTRETVKLDSPLDQWRFSLGAGQEVTLAKPGQGQTVDPFGRTVLATPVDFSVGYVAPGGALTLDAGVNGQLAPPSPNHAERLGASYKAVKVGQFEFTVAASIKDDPGFAGPQEPLVAVGKVEAKLEPKKPGQLGLSVSHEALRTWVDAEGDTSLAKLWLKGFPIGGLTVDGEASCTRTDTKTTVPPQQLPSAGVGAPVRSPQGVVKNETCNARAGFEWDSKTWAGTPGKSKLDLKLAFSLDEEAVRKTYPNGTGEFGVLTVTPGVALRTGINNWMDLTLEASIGRSNADGARLNPLFMTTLTGRMYAPPAKLPGPDERLPVPRATEEIKALTADPKAKDAPQEEPERPPLKLDFPPGPLPKPKYKPKKDEE